MNQLKYPIKPNDRTYDDTKFLGARIKPKQSRLELEVDLDTKNENYSKVKGEQFAINVDGGTNVALAGQQSKSKPLDKQPQAKYFRSNCMDKQVLTSTNGCLGQMNRLYYLGFLRNSLAELSLTPIQTILQMKPSFEYFDIFEKRVKETNKSKEESNNDYSTEEEADSEVDTKPELVTLKYGSGVASNQQQIQEQEHWVNLEIINFKESSAVRLKNALECHRKDNILKIDATNEELIRKSVDFNYTPNFDLNKAADK